MRHTSVVCTRLIEVEYAEIQDRKVRNQLQNVSTIERQVSPSWHCQTITLDYVCFAVPIQVQVCK